jgi:hypothetical protein
MDGNDILLLVLEDKRHLEPVDPEPQLMVQAHNGFRRQALGLAHLEAKAMADITMTGTTPTFIRSPFRLSV